MFFIITFKKCAGTFERQIQFEQFKVYVVLLMFHFYQFQLPMLQVCTCKNAFKLAIRF